MAAAGPGRWNDPDMLLIGANVTSQPEIRSVPPVSTTTPCLTVAEEKTQMAIWAVTASPLIMGNDVRALRDASRAILLNTDAIAVDQDPLGKPGGRLQEYNSSSPVQVWVRELSRSLETGRSRAAVVLYHKGPPKHPLPPPPRTALPLAAPADLRLDFAQVPRCGKGATVDVRDVWTGETHYRLTGGYVAKQVPLHGSAFLTLEW